MISMNIGLFIYVVILLIIFGAFIGLAVLNLIEAAKKRKAQEEKRIKDIEDYRKAVALNLEKISYYLEGNNGKKR